MTSSHFAVHPAQELWDDEIVIDSRKAIRNADKLIGEWMHGSRAKMPILTLSPKNGGNFRKVINSDYKANRKGTDKPVAYNAVIEHLENNYKVSRIEVLKLTMSWVYMAATLGLKAQSLSLLIKIF